MHLAHNFYLSCSDFIWADLWKQTYMDLFQNHIRFQIIGVAERPSHQLSLWNKLFCSRFAFACAKIVSFIDSDFSNTNRFRLTRVSRSSRSWLRPKSRTDHCLSGSDWRLTTRSDTTPREDTGEELSWVSKRISARHSSCTLYSNTPDHLIRKILL